ncbi:MAG: response regulator transcription factor [Actinobacteria bacterium]|nr:response regulator transcription factor [Actinomycetota bacterium]
MRVVLGRLVVDEAPDLASTLAELGRVDVLPTYQMDPSLVAQLADLKPDVVIVGRFMTELAFLLSEYLRQAGCSESPIVVAANPVTNALKIKVAHAGFDDVVDLGRPLPEIRTAIANIGQGKFALDDDPLWRRVDRPPRHLDLPLMTRDDVDIEILNLIAIGLSDQEISEVVHMSPQTIRNRVSHMLIRSGLANRTQLAWIFTHRNLLHHIVLGNGLAGPTTVE